MLKVRSRLNSSKKGFSLSIEALMGLILGVFALIFVLQVFFATMITTPSNLQIALDNANSIKEFVDYSNNFNKVTNCYTQLKLSNLENYQFEDKKKNYFYLITSNGVKVSSFNNIPILVEGSFDKIKFEKSINFNTNNINLIVDKTDQAAVFSFDIGYFNYGNGDSKLKLVKNPDLLYLMLQPKFKKGSFLGVDDFYIDNQQILYSQNIFKDGTITSEKGFYLTYIPSSKKLFLSNSGYSNNFIKNKNCGNKLFFEKMLLITPENADYGNYKLTFYPKKDGNVVDEKDFFIWNPSGSNSCPKSKSLKQLENELSNIYKTSKVRKSQDYIKLSNEIRKLLTEGCDNILGKGSNDMNYGDFITNMRAYYKKELNLDVVEFKISKERVVPTMLSKSQFYTIDYLFKELDQTKFKFTDFEKQKFKEIYLQRLENSKSIFGGVKNFFSSNGISPIEKKLIGEALVSGFSEKRVDECVSLLCDFLFVYNHEIYFYLPSKDNFVTFDSTKLQSVFRKDDLDNLFYLTANVPRREFDFPLYDIEVSTQSLTLPLTKGQLRLIEVNQ